MWIQICVVKVLHCWTWKMFLVTTNKVVTWEVTGTVSNVTYSESLLVEIMNKWTTKLHNITFPASITMYFEAFKGILHRTSCLFFYCWHHSPYWTLASSTIAELLANWNKLLELCIKVLPLEMSQICILEVMSVVWQSEVWLQWSCVNFCCI